MAEMIVGVYSFPKSGNTWMRHILGKALKLENIYKQIPDAYTDPIWDKAIDVGGRSMIIYKSHSKNELKNIQGREFENDLLLYIVRHPLDVFCSQLNFVSDNVMSDGKIMLPCESVSAIVEQGTLDLFFGAFCTYGTLQPTFADAASWFVNAEQWRARANAEPDRVFVVRYEDMMNQGAAALAPFGKELGLTEADLAASMEDARASTKPDGKFFWKQKTGNYKDLLSEDMIERFETIYKDRLTPLGY